MKGVDEVDYINKFLYDESKVVAIDFDGVIHNNKEGYHDGTIYGNPIDDSLSGITELYNAGVEIIIYSCKCHPDRPIVNGKNGTELIWEWLEKRGYKKYIKDVVWGKPHALIYIDDKGYRFGDWKTTVEFVSKLLTNSIKKETL